MAWFGLQEEEEIGVLLKLAIIGIVTLCGIDLFKRSLDFSLLGKGLEKSVKGIIMKRRRTSSRAMRFWMSNAIRESR
jgi:hypothetical protein